MSLDDAPMTSYLLLVGKSVHVPGHLSGGSCSEQNTKVNTLIGHHFKERNGDSRHTLCHIFNIYNIYIKYIIQNIIYNIHILIYNLSK